MNIAVLLGGISPERNISMVSGRAAVHALRSLGHSVRAIDPSRGADCILNDDELAAATPRAVTDEELAAFQDAGAKVALMGRPILRSAHAGIAAVSAVSALLKVW
jgi:D-alanine-D-alanine ligase-like ATP-grasp enzyme